MESDQIMSKIVIVGTTGSGKTTLAQLLAQRLNVPHIELDGIYWQENWEPLPAEIFRERVAQTLAAHPTWITDGNYRKVRDIVWGQADTLVWLDYPLRVIFWRLWWRTLRRVRTQEELWNGNQENWKDGFFSRESLFLWALKTQRRHRKTYPDLLQSPEFAHLNVIRLHSAQQTQHWLDTLTAATPTRPENT